MLLKEYMEFIFFIPEKFVDPIQAERKGVYYHRRYRRVPTIDECYTDDLCCRYEANEQYLRDK